jgi:hypothetical protein
VTTWHEARSADGARLADFIEANAPTIARNQERNLHHWRLGFEPTYYEADRVLVRCGLHPSQVPDELWSIDEPARPEQTCAHCGGPCTAWRSVYCTPQCAVAARGDKRLTKICESCGDEFEKPPSVSYERWSLARFCGEECRREGTSYTDAHGRWAAA